MSEETTAEKPKRTRKRKMIIEDIVEPQPTPVLGKALMPDPAQDFATKELPGQLAFLVPQSVEQMLNEASGSPAGYSAVSSYLECPERSRLRSLGIRRKELKDNYREFESDLEGAALSPQAGLPGGATHAILWPLNAMEFGTLMHTLLAARIVYGQLGAEFILNRYNGELHPDDCVKAKSLLLQYDLTYPIGSEPFVYLAVEANVVTDISLAPGALNGPRTGPTWRTVRYDAIVRPRDPTTGELYDFVYSLEHKTAARGGQGTINTYRGQFATQQTVWNANPALVMKYGRMQGVIGDLLIKTTVPKCERIGPTYFGPKAERLVARYLMAPDEIRFPTDPSGAFHHNVHACFGKWGPCQYIDLCWEDQQSNFIYPEKK